MTTANPPTQAAQAAPLSSHEAEERSFLEQRDKVADEALAARMNASPPCGGSLFVELSEFVARRRNKDAWPLATNCPVSLEPDDAN